jgi:uncharacterized protein
MKITNEILKRNNEIKDLCLIYGVKYLYVFGSAITGKFDKKTSDFDFVVEIDEKDPVEKGVKLLSIWDELEKLFQRKVDLLTDSSIKNPYLKASINSTKVLIYDGSRGKILI